MKFLSSNISHDAFQIDKSKVWQNIVANTLKIMRAGHCHDKTSAARSERTDADKTVCPANKWEANPAQGDDQIRQSIHSRVLI